MTEPKELITSYKRTQWLIEQQTAGLSHADSLLQLPFRANCMNWVLGHIVVHRDISLSLLGEASVLDEGETALYAFESEPITAENAAQALPLERLLAAAEQGKERLLPALKTLTPEAMATVVDEERGRTLGERLTFLHWHETYHVGQMEIFRQLAGKDDAII